MALINGTINNDLITPGAISPGVSGFPTAGADEIHGFEGHDNINGGGGNDVIYGDESYSNSTGNWNDTIDGGAGADQMHGFDGNDTYTVDNIGDDILSEINDAIGGVDTVRSSINVSLDNFSAGYALENVVLLGGTVLNAEGNANNNVMTGNGNVNSLLGREGNDTLRGGGGSDTLDGGVGADNLRGQAGNDIMVGGFNADVLIGGAGRDVFEFRSLQASLPGQRDSLRAGDGGNAFDGAGNAVGDTIDVSLIDANVTAGGNQTFTLGGSGKGHLTLSTVGGNTIVSGNVDNDAAYEFQFEIRDGAVSHAAYNANDFIL
jgi:Ca2+-binding RTX toxin-like protein